jgi:hypothetical protein
MPNVALGARTRRFGPVSPSYLVRPTPTVPDYVLDARATSRRTRPRPFVGSGTTAVAARNPRQAPHRLRHRRHRHRDLSRPAQPARCVWRCRERSRRLDEPPPPDSQAPRRTSSLAPPYLTRRGINTTPLRRSTRASRPSRAMRRTTRARRDRAGSQRQPLRPTRNRSPSYPVAGDQANGQETQAGQGQKGALRYGKNAPEKHRPLRNSSRSVTARSTANSGKRRPGPASSSPGGRSGAELGR